MTNIEKVKAIYPLAYIQAYRNNIKGSKPTHFIVWNKDQRLGCANTKALAWKEAANRPEVIEGNKLIEEDKALIQNWFAKLSPNPYHEWSYRKNKLRLWNGTLGEAKEIFRDELVQLGILK